MPIYEMTYFNDSARLRAWEAHYAAKGCSPTKARDVAIRKCFRSSTWPATQTKDQA